MLLFLKKRHALNISLDPHLCPLGRTACIFGVLRARASSFLVGLTNHVRMIGLSIPATVGEEAWLAAGPFEAGAGTIISCSCTHNDASQLWLLEINKRLDTRFLFGGDYEGLLSLSHVMPVSH